MAISSNKEQKEQDSLIESTSTPGQPAQAVCNPDGSDIGSGGGGGTGGATSVVTSVNDSASSVTLLSSNAARLKYSVFNNSTEILYLKEGITASLTNFTVAIPPLAQYGFYESTSYTGRVDGIWANNSTGAALITEITA